MNFLKTLLLAFVMAFVATVCLLPDDADCILRGAAPLLLKGALAKKAILKPLMKAKLFKMAKSKLQRPNTTPVGSPVVFKRLTKQVYVSAVAPAPAVAIKGGRIENQVQAQIAVQKGVKA